MDYTALAGVNDMTPTHASHLNQYAQEDGVNPYTATPIKTSQALRDPQAESAPEVATPYNPTHDAEIAAVEATTIAAPDTDMSERFAAQKSATVVSPDVDLLSNGTIQGSYLITAISKVETTTDQAPIGVSSEVVPGPMVPTHAHLNPTSEPSEVVDTPTAEATSEEDSKRPTLAEARVGHSHDSVSSISQLHIPGEFPKGM